MKVLKIPSLKKGGENYQSFKKLFRAYARKLNFLECLNEGVDTTSEQQAACYADLLLATKYEDDHSYFAGIDEEDEHAGTLAWCVLMDVYDDEGVHIRCELMEEYNRK